MPLQVAPYPAFTYFVELTTNSDSKALGGFWHVSGLPPPNSATTADYAGGQGFIPVKMPGTVKVSDVTLKRGVVNSSQLWNWLDSVRGSGSATAPRTVHITLRDETRQPVTQWTLHSATPKHWDGPTLSARRGDVAIEELILSAESIEIARHK
jgi:phage tail-like protein